MPNYSGIWTRTQQMQAKAANNWPTVPPPAIGSPYGGGFFAGQISTAGNGIADYNLVVGPLSSGQSQLLWKNANTDTPGASSVIDGPQNTADIVVDGNSTVYPAAHFCNDAVIGGFSDWYMPSMNELEIIYYNLKPTTDPNNSTFGINPNAVPARPGTYTGGTPATNPAQTTAVAFQSGGSEALFIASYWTSTEFSSSTARGQDFTDGVQNDNANKTNSRRTRVVRRVPV